jgi:hypothetical protein
VDCCPLCQAPLSRDEGAERAIDHFFTCPMAPPLPEDVNFQSLWTESHYRLLLNRRQMFASARAAASTAEADG